ncbi:MAG: hypothetical protein GY798_04855 [Hyphomicrobiales bacterium]|nr:hypothetical protein [Hyphomicrobiales bacterium]
MVVAAARDRTALLIIAADAATPEFADLLDLLADDKRASVVIAPQSAHARRVAGVLLSFRTPAHSEIFSQTALRYKQAIVVDLLCTGHALNLSDRADERRRPVMPNPAPPMKGQPMSGAE